MGPVVLANHPEHQHKLVTAEAHLGDVTLYYYYINIVKYLQHHLNTRLIFTSKRIKVTLTTFIHTNTHT